MKAAVVGGCGFIGHNLVKTLLDHGNEVVVIDDLSTGKRENIDDRAEFFRLDISQHDITENILGCEVVFITAAKARVQPSIKDPLTYNRVNVGGLLNVLVACVTADVKRVVFSSSSSVYGETDVLPTPETQKHNPLSPYALQKSIGEQYCKLFSDIYELDTVCLRYFNVYGQGMPLTGAYRTVLSIFGEQHKNGEPLTYTNDGTQKRDFTHVDDVVDANIKAGIYQLPLEGGVFNIGNGNNVSINEVMDMFGGAKIKLDDRLEPHETLADNSKAREILQWEPKGDLKKFIEQYKEELKPQTV